MLSLLTHYFTQASYSAREDPRSIRQLSRSPSHSRRKLPASGSVFCERQLPFVARLAPQRLIVKQAEYHSLISNNHFLGRPGRTTTDSLHYITTIVKNAWRKRHVASALFLDIKAAFPSVSTPRLFHEMRMRGIPQELTQWFARKLHGRQTTLLYDDYESPALNVDNGLDQGCPASVIMYQLYNTSLLEKVDQQPTLWATGNIDDVAVIAEGPTFQDTHQQLQTFMEQPDGALQWSKDSHSTFSVGKFGLLNCSRRSKDLGPPLTLQHHTIDPAISHMFLGVKVDRTLRWHEQTNRAIEKGTKWISLFRRMANTKRGVSSNISRRLYLAVAVPSMLYAADVFLNPTPAPSRRQSTTGSVQAVRRLTQVQRQAAILITGAMRTTATDVMESHANLLPMTALVRQLCQRAAIRLCTLPSSHPLHPFLARATRYVRRHRSNLHELLHAFNLHPKNIETIDHTCFSPRWKSKFRTRIADDKDEAAESDKWWTDHSDIRVYTDGSDYQGGVGCAAILFPHSEDK